MRNYKAIRKNIRAVVAARSTQTGGLGYEIIAIKKSAPLIAGQSI